MLVAVVPACCGIPAPTVQQGLNYGFREPDQAYESWRTAFQGDLLVEEYRCFSRGWKQANGVRSLTTYGAGRDALLERVPRLRWLLGRAEPPEEVARTEGSVTFQARVPAPLWYDDRYLLVNVVREAYFEVYPADNPSAPEAAETFGDPWAARVFDYRADADLFSVGIAPFDELTGGLAPEAVHEIRAGWQWKINEIEVLDDPVVP